MAEEQPRQHLILRGITETSRFKSPRQLIKHPQIPDRDRSEHANALRQDLKKVAVDANVAKQRELDAGIEDDLGLIVEFEGFDAVDLAFESLERERQGIELLNVRIVGQRTLATVFVPDGKLVHFEKLLKDYVEERRSKNGRKLDHSTLVNAIQSIRSASLRALWTDSSEFFPQSDEEALWWEVWLPTRRDRHKVEETFVQFARAQNMVIGVGRVEFPERTVLLAHASAAQMKQSVMTLNSVAELRRAKETANFFDALPPNEQPAWVNDLRQRTSITESEADVPHVCILDTGVNRGHPLLTLGLHSSDVHVIEPEWGLEDSEGHGTGMAGLALYGDLTDLLANQDVIQINHRLESVKLLAQDGGNIGDSKHHGYLTIEAASRPEVSTPNRRRVYSMSITAKDHRDQGRPSSWSAAIDRLAADVDNDGQAPRLFVISAGNVDQPNAWMIYPDSNTTDGIHDPGQSWNALTVGACTNLTHITEDDATDYQPIAPAGGLSPFSTTSQTWGSTWPMKPDVVFEGGNAAKDAIGAMCMPSLSLLTVNNRVQERLFTTTNATSAATALAARMSAQVMAAYPTLWPETVRALIVHSAEWTEAMQTTFLPADRPPTKGDIGKLVRHCGFGMPNIKSALWSAADSLTLVVEEALHPFKQEKSNTSMRDMHLHRLPWPVEELQALGETQVQMRVTLSYFVEPNPSARGVRSRYRYQSHGLRFDVKRPLESEGDFKARINADARDEEYGGANGNNDAGWLLGKQKRHHGSIHSDIWTGGAAELASRGIIGVYPAMGWWRTRQRLKRADSSARYALVVSIRAPETDIDLYNAIESQITHPIAIDIGGES